MKSGIEIHQRLNTKRKLFCNCPTTMSGKPMEKTLTRKLRAVSGELGLTDQAAMYEYLRGRNFVYQRFFKESCLVEEDDEPPRPMNREALLVGLQVAKMLNCDIPDEIHVMRKTVIDGSNTSGFQRTAIVGMNGSLEASFGSVGITNVSIEEESAQIIEKEGKTITYALNRMGIPLVEIGTAPDMTSPEQVREVAEKIGTMLRSTGKVKRGIGSIRQDLNVSVEGGNRIEVKGFQELKMIGEAVKTEAERQDRLLKLIPVLKKRDIDFSQPQDMTRIFANTKNKMLKNGVDEGRRVYAFSLKGFGGLLKGKISGEKTLGKELAEYAIAQGTRGMIHTDEDVGKYDLTREFTMLKSELDIGEEDAVCVIVADEDVAKRACSSVIERAKKCLEEIPKETRSPNPDGTSSYMRPLPGGERMYPETDVPPILVTEELLNSVTIPEPFAEKKIRFISLGLSDQMAGEVLRSERLNLFEMAADKGEPSKIAELLISQFTALRREGIDVDGIGDGEIMTLIENMSSIPRESMPDAIARMASGEKIESILEKTEILSEEDVEKMVGDVMKKNVEMIKEKADRAFQPLMGLAMAELKGKVSGETVAEMIKRKLKERRF